MAAVPLFSALPAQAATGDGAIQVHLKAPGGDRTDLSVHARRQGTDAQPRDVDLRILLNDNYYSSGPIAHTNSPASCQEGEYARNYLFDITVTDPNNNDAFVAGQNAVLVCGQTGSTRTIIASVDINVPAKSGGGNTPPSNTYLHGRITSPDGKPAPHVILDFTPSDGNGPRYNSIKPEADGKYLLPNIDVGKYDIRATGYTGEPPNGSSVDEMRQGIQIKAGENVLDLVVGSGDIVIKEDPDCDAGNLNWLICNPVRLALGVIDWVRDSVLVPFLKEPPINPTGGDDYSKPVYDVWSALRNLANVAFILIFILAIVGTAVGYDNYTVKKVLPRLVAAVILVQLSFLMGSLIVDVGNVLGQGLGALGSSVIPPPKIDFTQSWSAKGFFLGTSLLGVAGGVAAIVTLSASSILAMLVSMLVLFLTLVIRKVLILALLAVGPIAFVLWVLPNTEKYFKEWYQSLLRLSLMYPMIIGLFEAGRLFAKAAELTGGDGSFGSTTLAPIFVIAGYAIPIMLAPVTFLLAGRVMGAASGGLRKLSDRLDRRGSEGDHRRAANRKYRSALGVQGRPVTPLGRGMNAIGLGRIQRAAAARRGGFQGLAGKQAAEAVAEKGINDRAKARAQQADRAQHGMQTADEAVAARASALQDKMLDQRVAEASYGRTASGQTIRTATLDEHGIQELCAVIRSSLQSNNQAAAIAAMQRLSTTKEGMHALQGLRTSEFGGTDTDLVGHGMNADAQARYKTIWEKGTKGAKGVDVKKPPVSAFRDVSQAEFATMTSEEATRALDYFHRNINAEVPAGASPEQAATVEQARASATRAAAEFNDTVQKALANPKMLDQMSPDMVRVVVQAGVDHPNVIHPETLAAAQRVSWNQGSVPAGYRVTPPVVGPTQPWQPPRLVEPEYEEPEGDPHDPRAVR